MYHSNHFYIAYIRIRIRNRGGGRVGKSNAKRFFSTLGVGYGDFDLFKVIDFGWHNHFKIKKGQWYYFSLFILRILTNHNSMM